MNLLFIYIHIDSIFSYSLFSHFFFFFFYSCNKQVAFYVGKGLIVFLSQSFLVLFFFSLPCIHSFRFNLQLKHTYSIFDTIVRLKLLKKKKKKTWSVCEIVTERANHKNKREERDLNPALSFQRSETQTDSLWTTIGKSVESNTLGWTGWKCESRTAA